MMETQAEMMETQAEMMERVTPAQKMSGVRPTVTERL
jgi:hypothetical protein